MGSIIGRKDIEDSENNIPFFIGPHQCGPKNYQITYLPKWKPIYQIAQISMILKVLCLSYQYKTRIKLNPF
ncbi:hypothetical protein BpHYR1_007098 [Brachionus plicatilis]|uniref:Uncharacterized protein n=1 Tax=Brachionus plicatilis TaxID=10195 RepID=A0A3M7P9J7_BRAPC|nr:hypothetical protein BpHYR1_007098 [Brachionus plicatilis]